MKRKITVFVLIILCFLLQTTVFKSIAFASVSPNLMIVVTSAIGFMRGKKEGMLVGFFSGLLMDIFFGSALGLYAMIYMYIGYLNGFFRKLFFPEDIKLPILLISGSDLLVNIVIYILLFFFRSRFHFGYYLLNIMMPEVVYTILVSIVLYFIILRINQKLEAIEKRSAVKFGGKNKELFS
ncbi:MAG: rod shape-determining protein MreD [Lachnospiraceae bacterium]